MAFLKTREEQDKILKVGIRDFYIVTNVLHVHMEQNTVMRIEFDNRMTTMEKICKDALNQADKARSTADKKKTVAYNVNANKKRATKVVEVSKDGVKEGSSSVSLRKKAGGDIDCQLEEGANLPMLAAAMNINLDKNLKPGETPIWIRVERHSPRT